MDSNTAGTGRLLSRLQIIEPLVAALQSALFVQAAWQGGAAAFGRVDEWSDIDLVIVADDDHCDDVWPIVDETLAKISLIDTKFVIPAPPLGLHSQRFYRLRDAGPFLLVDVGLFRASAPDKLLDPAVHGDAIIHFDKNGFAKPPSDCDDTRRKLIASRLETLAVTVPLFQALVDKEINRGNDIEAVAFYHGWSLRPLVELLRIKHCPARYNFHTRYVQYDLPVEVVNKLRPLVFVKDLPDIARCRRECEAWSLQLLEELTK
jgi:predicted nucleotidyltransferase